MFRARYTAGMPFCAGRRNPGAAPRRGGALDPKIDLHLHTTRSDGLHPPVEVVRLAVSAGVTVASITDHDTLGAYPEARAEAERLGITLIPGT